MNYDWGLIVLDLILTFVFFTIGPFIRFHKKRHLYTNKEIKKFNILNSIIVQLLFIVIITIISDKPEFNFVPAFIYYFINQWIWTHKNKDNNTKQNETKNDIIKSLDEDKSNSECNEITDTENPEEETSDIMNFLNK